MTGVFCAPSLPPCPPAAACLPGDPFETSAVNSAPLQDKRREVRYPTYEHVEVCLLEMAGEKTPGVLRDVSRSGLRVDLGVPVTTGARIRVSIRDQVIVFAEARYCRKTRDTYRVGARIEAMYCLNDLQAARVRTADATPTLRERMADSKSDHSPAECRDLARAIIDDHMLFGTGSGGRAGS
jgi:hypothetical protein